MVAVFTVVLAWIGKQQADLLKQTDETQRASQRAYVVPKEVKLVATRISGGAVDYWRASFLIENAGESAATHATFKLGAQYGPPQDPETTELPVSGADKWDGEIGPHQAYPVHDMIITRSAEERIIKGQGLFVLGVVDYQDVFGASHTTEYCFHVYGGPWSTNMPDQAINIIIDKTDLGFNFCRHNNHAT